MRKITTALLFSGLSLASVATVQAESSDFPHHQQMQDQRERMGMPENMFKDLELTTQQKQQIRQIMQQSFKDLPRNSRLERSKQLHQLVISSNFDQHKAQQLVNQISQQQAQRMIAGLAAQNKIYHVLTPQQQEKYNQRFQQKMDRANRWQEKH